MRPLTKEQDRVLSFIVQQQKERGVPPTIREIAGALGYKSINNVRQHLHLIEQKGYIRVLRGKARGLELLATTAYKQNKELQVPLIGSVAAGRPITAMENLEGHITLDRDIFRDDGLFTLRIKGDSMVGVGVLDGDIVIVKPQNSAKNNDIVVAIVDDEATLKRYIKTKDRIILQAENPKYHDIVIPADRGVWIAGKMVGVIRKC